MGRIDARRLRGYRSVMGATALPRTWPLVGRAAELDLVGDAMRRSDVSGVVLVGPAGVGKTRLATACLELAGRIGFDTVRVTATEGSRNIPLGALAPLLPPLGGVPEPMVDAIGLAVRALSVQPGGDPRLVLVDDAHLLDDASATVLHQLTAAGGLFVVTTVRSGPMLPGAVEALWKDQLVARIDLAPLDRASTAAMVAAVLDGPVEGGTTDVLWHTSQGNPLYIRELVQGSFDAGLLVSDGGTWYLREALTVSPRLAELVEARLSDLDDEERATLEVVAFGEPLGLELLVALGSYEALERLERRGLIEVTTERRRRPVRLAHPLHGEVVRARVPTLRAMAVQRRLAEVVGSFGERRREDALRVAVWSVASGSETPVGATVTAARHALFANDLDLAERLAAVAHDAGAGVEAVHLLGEAHYRRGDPERAEALLSGAEVSGASDTLRALVAMTRAGVLFEGMGRKDEAFDVLESAASALDTGGPWLGEVQAVRAAYEMLSGAPREAHAMVGPLLATGEGRAFVVAATAAAPSLAVMGRTAEAVDVADRGFAAHVALGEQSSLASPGIHLVAKALALGEAGALAEAADIGRAGYESAIAERSTEGQAWFALILGRSLWLSRPREALRWFREGALLFRQIRQGGQRRWCLAGGALAAATAGDAETSSRLLRAIDEIPADHFGLMRSDVERAYAWHAVARGDLRAAHDRLVAAAHIARESGAAALEIAALHDRARLGRPEAVADRLSAVAASVEGELSAVRDAHARALLQRDAGALDIVAQRFEALGADVLAVEAMAQASGSARQSGERRLAERLSQHATGVLERTGPVATPALALAGEAARLTDREREVVALAADGWSNRDIADRLVVSVRTVGNHLQRSYDKLGVSSRKELADAVSHSDGGSHGAGTEPLI